MTAATLLSKNLIKLAKPDISDDQTALIAKWSVPVIMLIVVYFTLSGNQTIVALLLMGYSFVTQLFPALVISLMKRNPLSPLAAMCGIVVGVLVAAFLTFTHATVGGLMPWLPQAIQDFNVGIIALIANVVVLLVVGAVTRPATESQEA
jgi:SSS family solute:Na+ symporter